MRTFQYQLLRFLPDRVSGEFINLGIVVYDVKEKKLAVEILDKTGRLSQIFPNTNTRYLLKTLTHINSQLRLTSNQLNGETEFEYYKDLNQITRKALPKDDSALFFTETQKILDIDIDAVSTYLFDRLISVNQADTEKGYRSDKEVWSKVYKKYFDNVNISKYLKPFKIQTKFENVIFEHSWKNGHINFFEAVNFDLEKTESIRNKVFRWAGQIDELNTSNEKSHLYLLSILPKQDHSTNNFIRDFLCSKSSKKVKVEIVTPENIELITKELKEEIELHERV